MGLLQPIPLIANQPVKQGVWSYQLVHDNELWQLQSLRNEQWQTLYEFSLERQLLPDLEIGNYYVSTHPNSRFTLGIAVQRSTGDTRYLLRNLDLTIDRGGNKVETSVCAEDDLVQYCNSPLAELWRRLAVRTSEVESTS